MGQKYLAAIDVGTTGAKTGIFTLDGALVAKGYKEYGCTYPKPNWVEQDMDELFTQAIASIKEAIKSAGVDNRDIISLSLSTQRCSAIFLDKDDKVLKMISWQDNRSGQEVDDIKQLITPEEHYAITGLPLAPTWISSKILWLKKNEPDTYGKIHKIAQVQDYFFRKFGADGYYLDNPEAVFYGLWDIDNLCWSKKLLHIYDIDQKKLPDVVSAGTQIGTLSKEIAEKTGLAKGTPLCVGLGDQNSATAGAGVVETGKASVSIGTGGMSIVFLDSPYRCATGNTMVTNHAIDGKWQLEGLQAGAASVFRWFRDEIAWKESQDASQQGVDPYVLLSEKIGSVPLGAKGLVFLPFLAGSTSPRWNANARGTLIGLTFAHDRYCIARAFMEGITMEQKDILTKMQETGIQMDTISVVGGATKSKVWNQIQADMYNKPVQVLEIQDAALLGAAITAGVGVGVFGSIKEGSEKMVKVKKTYYPIPEHVEIYNNLYEIYCKVYESLSGNGVYTELAKLQ